MSIYFYANSLNEIFERPAIHNITFPGKIAIAKNKRGEIFSLKFSEYSEKRLQEMISKKMYTEVLVHPIFWNYKFCSISNLDLNKDISLGFKKPTSINVNLEDYFIGKLLMLISFFNILVLTYTIKKEKDYNKYIRELNIDRRVFGEFLISNNYGLTLTDNYLSLIKRVFTDDNILNFVFNEPMRFIPEQVKIILNNYDFGSINNASYFVFNNNFNTEEKLFYSEALIDIYDEDIDSYKELSFSVKNFYPLLAFYLYSMDIPENLTNLYFCVVDKFLNNGGAYKLTIIDDNELNNKLLNRFKIIKDYFNLD